MRLASFNVENMFRRARALNLETWKDGKDVLAQYAKLNTLLQGPIYTPAIKKSILAALEKLGLKKSNESTFVLLRENHGHLLKRPKSGPVQVIADKRADWIGWLELKTEAVNDKAVQMTAKVIKELDADVLAVIEAEDRIALGHFNDQLLKPIKATYGGIMLIDGNDERGIDVGLFTKSGSSIESIVSHVDDLKGTSKIFSRDCPEFTVRVSDTKRILVMVNHFKSKGFGSQGYFGRPPKSASKTRPRDL